VPPFVAPHFQFLLTTTDGDGLADDDRVLVLKLMEDVVEAADDLETDETETGEDETTEDTGQGTFVYLCLRSS
jgi:hypothetical protein